MGLIAHLRQRTRARASHAYWRARYIYLDTPRGAQLRIGAVVMALIVVVALGASGLLQLIEPSPAHAHAQHAVVLAIIAIIVAVLAAALAVVMAPKPNAAAKPTADAPTTQDGQSVPDIFGTVWTDDSFILAWKLVGTSPVKAQSK